MEEKLELNLNKFNKLQSQNLCCCGKNKKGKRSHMLKLVNKHMTNKHC